MKNFIVTIVLLISSFSFSQQSGAISGQLLDNENMNQGLLFANVSIKNKGLKTTTDIDGTFNFKNLEAGTYTLVCDFVGYETIELEAKVAQGKVTTVKSTLNATSISLDELMATLASADKTSNVTKD